MTKSERKQSSRSSVIVRVARWYCY